MTFSSKRKAFDALGKENFFSASSAAAFLEQSTYGKRNEWLAEIQAGQAKFYATSLENDVTRLRRQNFRLLSKLQVEEIMPNISNGKIKKYVRILLCLHDTKFIIKQRECLCQMANRLEDNIINDDTISDYDDLRRFLMVAVLYGDKNHFYDRKTLENFDHICKKI